MIFEQNYSIPLITSEDYPAYAIVSQHEIMDYTKSWSAKDFLVFTKNGAMDNQHISFWFDEGIIQVNAEPEIHGYVVTKIIPQLIKKADYI